MTERTLDEQRIGDLVRVAIPGATLVSAALVGILMGPGLAILVLAAGVLLGVIALFWSSLRVLSGDAPLPVELESLDGSARGIDALSSRKKMLLRALKDLDNELSLGKLAHEDHDDVARTYRAELKEVLKQIDDSLAPHRARAEELARKHLVKVGAIAGTEGEPLSAPELPEAAAEEASSRRVCAACGVSNEPDAKFCKGCGATLESADA